MTRTVKSIDLKAAWAAQADELSQAAHAVLEGGWYILGPRVEQFEAAFADWCGGGEAVGVANGTDAIVIALEALGIGAGDAVLSVSHTAVATIAAIEMSGATPVFVDIDPRTFTMSPARLAETLEGWSRRDDAKGLTPRAVLPVHLYGQPADMAKISEIARAHGLRIIEDCAQAHGAKIGGRCVGQFGDAATFSFYPTKNLGAFGDGGAVLSRTPGLCGRMRQLREYGWRERYVSGRRGRNSRLDELQAALLSVRLGRLSGENRTRIALARRYDAALRGLAGKGLAAPVPVPGHTHVYHQYVIRSAGRDRLKAELAKHGVNCLIHYPVPVHRQPAYADGPLHGAGGLAHTERAAGEVLSLPLHPWLAEEDVDYVADLLVRFCQGDP